MAREGVGCKSHDGRPASATELLAAPPGDGSAVLLHPEHPCAPTASTQASVEASREKRVVARAEERVEARRECVMALLVYPRIVGSWKVLVVDDDPDIRRIAALSLERIGKFQVTVAASGEEAIAAVRQDMPDLVLLDVSMPGTDGPTTLQLLRAVPGTERLPVIFFTATSNDAEVQRLVSLGAIGVLPKPFDVADLPRRVRAIAAESGLH